MKTNRISDIRIMLDNYLSELRSAEDLHDELDSIHSILLIINKPDNSIQYTFNKFGSDLIFDCLSEETKKHIKDLILLDLISASEKTINEMEKYFIIR